MQILVLSFLNKGNATRDEEEARKGERRWWKGAGGRRRGKGEGVRGRRMSMEKGTEKGKGGGVKGRRGREGSRWEKGEDGKGGRGMRKRKIEGDRRRRKGKGEEDGKDGMIQKGGLNKFFSPVNDRILPSFLSVKYFLTSICV
jgi:hypothetical protein